MRDWVLPFAAGAAAAPNSVVGWRLLLLAADVSALLHEMCSDLNAGEADRGAAAPAQVRAAIAYLNVALIHPFTDANGRAARCFQALVLARASCRSAAFCSLDRYLGYRTQRASDSPLPPDHLADVLLPPAETEDDGVLALLALDAHGVRLVDEPLREECDQLVHVSRCCAPSAAS